MKDSRPTLTVSIWMESFCFEIEVKDHSLENATGNGTRVYREARSFRDNYDVVKAAEAAAQRLLMAMLKLEANELRPMREARTKKAKRPV